MILRLYNVKIKYFLKGEENPVAIISYGHMKENDFKDWEELLVPEAKNRAISLYVFKDDDSLPALVDDKKFKPIYRAIIEVKWEDTKIFEKEIRMVNYHTQR